MRYLLDSNTLNLLIYRRGGVDQRVRNTIQDGDVIGTGMPIVAEILGGVMVSATWQSNLPLVEQKLKQIRIWPFDFVAAREYARLFAELRKAGVTMQTIDLMIAAIAFVIPNCTVVTTDSDLLRVPGLRVENWSV